jgi:hypothetical protein
MLLCLSALLLASLLWPWQSTAILIRCLDSTNTLEDMIICFDSYTVPPNSYSDINAYNAVQPHSHEKTAWNAIVASLLTVDHSNCTSSLLPAALSGVYSVSLFREAGTGGRSFCVLSEVNSRDSHYARGWGLMVVPATRSAVSRYIHISAPHPKADGNTPEQAAVLFKNTGAKSLLAYESVTMVHRETFLGQEILRSLPCWNWPLAESMLIRDIVIETVAHFFNCVCEALLLRFRIISQIPLTILEERVVRM